MGMKSVFCVIFSLFAAVGVSARAAVIDVTSGNFESCRALKDGNTYRFVESVTFAAPSGESALKVADGAAVTLNIPSGVTVTLTGGSANGTTGAGAGIEVPASATLTIVGDGTLNVTGGKAANGANGEQGTIPASYDSSSEKSTAASGGKGGNGGGGAGAGIGGRGGNGGNGGKGGAELTDKWNKYEQSGNSGTVGAAGGDGGSYGTVIICESVTVTAIGGAAGVNGSGGDRQDWCPNKGSTYYWAAYGSGGGGGGGGGLSASDIGGGGAGGGGAGGGGGGGLSYSGKSSAYNLISYKKNGLGGLGGVGRNGSASGGKGTDRAGESVTYDGTTAQTETKYDDDENHYSGGAGGAGGAAGAKSCDWAKVTVPAVVGAVARVAIDGTVATEFAGGELYVLPNTTVMVDYAAIEGWTIFGETHFAVTVTDDLRLPGEGEEPTAIKLFALTVPAIVGATVSVTTNGASVADFAGGELMVLSNTTVTVEYAATEGWVLHGKTHFEVTVTGDLRLPAEGNEPIGLHIVTYMAVETNEIGEITFVERVTNAVPVTEATDRFGNGWYVVMGTISRGGIDIPANCTVNLILADGASLTVQGADYRAGIDVRSGKTLNIYGQRNGTGQLTAMGGSYGAGIGGRLMGAGGTVTINGGTVTATGGKYGAGIGGGGGGGGAGGTVIINGGTVTATGGSNGAGIGGGRDGAGGTVIINGGMVTATGNSGGKGIGSGNGNGGGSVGIYGGRVRSEGWNALGETVTLGNEIWAYDIAGGEPGTLIQDKENLTSAANILVVNICLRCVTVPAIVGATVSVMTNGASVADFAGGELMVLSNTTVTVEYAATEGWVLHGKTHFEVTVTGDLRLPAEGNEPIGLHIVTYMAVETNEIGEITFVERVTNAVPVTEATDRFGNGWYVVMGTISRGGIDVAANCTANLILADCASLTVQGADYCAGIDVRSGETLNIYGQRNGTGQLTAKGGHDGAGIGGGDGGAGGIVTINGGEVTATGGEDGAGIGGGFNLGAGGTVKINGGTVIATGDRGGAGIGGGGYKGAGGTITINGGTVTATGGKKGAVGIGGGSYGAGGTVTINGGEVTATGGEDGAGIGGGTLGRCEAVTINGGMVTATGGISGAGIGGGWSGAGGTVTVNGGTVTATGGKYGAGIGGGWDGDGGEVAINGGTVTAIGRDGGRGIGGGNAKGGGAVSITGGTVRAEGWDALGETVVLGDNVFAYDVTGGEPGTLITEETLLTSVDKILAVYDAPVGPTCEDGTIAEVGGTWVVTPNTGVTALTIAGLPEGAKLAVKCGDYSVPSAAFVGFGEGKTEGAFSLALNPDGVVDGVPVKPTIGNLNDGDPFVVGETGVEVTIKTIPGLVYELKRTDDLGSGFGSIDEGIRAIGDGNPVKLIDNAPPSGQAFYIIDVSTP